MVKYSVVVPHYNEVSRAKKLVGSLRSQSFRDYEVIIVDDCSEETDYSELKGLARGKRNFSVLRSPENKGPANARNLGIKVAKGKFIVFTDSDCILPADYLEKIDSFYKNKSNEDCVLQGRARIFRSGAVGNVVSSLGFPAGGHVGFDKVWPVDSKGRTRQLVTCNCVVPKSVIDSVGVFDTSFPVQFGEDTDFGLRVVHSGRDIIFNPKLYIYHPPRDSLKSFLRWTWIRGKGAYHFKRKNPGVAKGFLKTRLWSSRNILWYGFRTGRFLLVALFLFMYLSVFYAGFVCEGLRIRD